VGVLRLEHLVKVAKVVEPPVHGPVHPVDLDALQGERSAQGRLQRQLDALHSRISSYKNTLAARQTPSLQAHAMSARRKEVTV
jgi:hypothetical protein